MWLWVLAFALNAAFATVDLSEGNPMFLFHGGLIAYLLWRLPAIRALART